MQEYCRGRNLFIFHVQDEWARSAGLNCKTWENHSNSKISQSVGQVEWESPLLEIFVDSAGVQLPGYVQTDYSAVQHRIAQTPFQVLPWHSFSWSCGKAGAGIDMLLWEGNMKSEIKDMIYSGLRCAGFYATFFANWYKIQPHNY